MRMQIDGTWEGWDGDTIVRLTDGSIWRQEQYHYEYRYSYRPYVVLQNDMMQVDGSNHKVRVRRIY